MRIEKAISLIQPWASALFVTRPDGRGPIKKVETRSWRLPERTVFPVRVAVHASKAMPVFAKKLYIAERDKGLLPAELPMGSILGLVTIMGCRMTDDLISQLDETELNYGDYSPGRWGWMLCDPVLLDTPIQCRGALGLWTIPREIRESHGWL